MKKRLKKIEEQLPGEEVLKKKVSRKAFVAGAGATSFGLLLAACGGDDDSAEPAPPAEPEPEPPAEEPAPEPPAEEPAAPTEEPSPTPAPTEALKPGLADGMYGGPTGFEGAEAYQYPLDSSEGRAIEGLRQLVADGRAPDTIVAQPSVGALGHFIAGHPEGAKSLAELLEEETGIRLEFIDNVPNTELYQSGLKETQTRSGNWAFAEFWYEHKGDFVEAGLWANLDEFVDRYNPDWADDSAAPEDRYLGADVEEALINKYKGSTHLIAFDGDYKVWAYNSALTTDPQHQAQFADQYGYELPEFPYTWEQQADVAQYFTDQGFFGSVDQKNPQWGYTNWGARFVSAEIPNKRYFNSDGSANINNEAGWRATEEHVKSLDWTYDGALSKSFPEMYTSIGDGEGVMASGYPNFTKFLIPGLDIFGTGEAGPFIKEEVAPGRIVDGQLNRRTIIHAHTSYAVNGFTDRDVQETAYLILQWAGSATMYTYFVQNPAGFWDPNRVKTLNDPGVAAAYQPFEGQNTLEALPRIAEHAAPDISYRGANEYITALDINLQKAFTGQSTAEEAMAATSDEWDAITERIGVEAQVEAFTGEDEAWPVVIDEVPPELQ